VWWHVQGTIAPALAAQRAAVGAVRAPPPESRERRRPGRQETLTSQRCDFTAARWYTPRLASFRPGGRDAGLHWDSELMALRALPPVSAEQGARSHSAWVVTGARALGAGPGTRESRYSLVPELRQLRGSFLES